MHGQIGILRPRSSSFVLTHAMTPHVQPPSRLHDLARRYNTDKAVHIHYLKNYEDAFTELVDRDVRLLELGVKHGGSLLLWRDYFERGAIVGLDINPVSIDDASGRIHTYQGPQQDTALLTRIAHEVAPDGFDVIIDDCSHIGVLSRVSFWHLFDNHLKPGGLYIIEDWGTGYWDHWVDGAKYKPGTKSFSQPLYKLTRILARLQQVPSLKRLPFVRTLLRQAKASVVRREFHSHDCGMVGLVKELIDELGKQDIATAEGGSGATSKFREMKVYPSHLFITKSQPAI